MRKRVGHVNKLSNLEEVIIEQVVSRTIATTPLPYDVKLEDVERFFKPTWKGIYLSVLDMITQ